MNSFIAPSKSFTIKNGLLAVCLRLKGQMRLLTMDLLVSLPGLFNQFNQGCYSGFWGFGR